MWHQTQMFDTTLVGRQTACVYYIRVSFSCISPTNVVSIKYALSDLQCLRGNWLNYGIQFQLRF